MGQSCGPMLRDNSICHSPASLPCTTWHRQSIRETSGFATWLHARPSACTSISAVSAILHTNASYSPAFNLFSHIDCTTEALQTALDSMLFFPWLQFCEMKMCEYQRLKSANWPYTFLNKTGFSISKEVFLYLTTQVVCEHFNAFYSFLAFGRLNLKNRAVKWIVNLTLSPGSIML